MLEEYLTSFGDFIQKMWIIFDLIDIPVGYEIIGLINDKNLISLTTITLEGCSGNILDRLKKTFRNVYRFAFSSHAVKELIVNAEHPKFYEIFPNVEHLIFLRIKSLDWVLFWGEFSNLTYLDFEYHIDQRPGAYVELDFSNFLKINKNVQDIRIKYASLKVLKRVRDCLPGIESLIIDLLANDYLNYEGDVIEFNNVKMLAISTFTENEILQKIVFNGIVEISLYVDTRFTEKWYDFLSNHSHLIAFSLYTHSLHRQQLIDIPNYLPELITVKIDCPTEFTANDVILFIEKCKKANLFELSFSMVGNEQQKLQQTLFNFQYYFKFIPKQYDMMEIVIKR